MRKSNLQPFSSKEQKKRNYGAGNSASDVAKKTEVVTETKKPTEDINASADAFIKNFRQQLLIQRLQSIENYEKMLARGL